MSTALPLDALACPLTGVNLIEASAGTGKTWTIAALFTRLLLESRDGLPPPTVDQVLVVTYTKAATAELRDRLRARLSQMARVFEGEPAGDPFLAALAARFPEGPARRDARRRLKAALSGFDAAAIYTIHGFCQRVLTDAAFESGQTFTAELVSDDIERLTEVVDDFWRREVVPDPVLSRVLAENQETPDVWLREIRPYLSKPYLQARRPESEALHTARAAVEAAWQALSATPAALFEGLERVEGAGTLKGNIYTASGMVRLRRLLTRLLQAPGRLPVLDGEARKLLGRLTPAELVRGTKKGGEPPTHPVFAAVDAWLAAWDVYLREVVHHLAGLKIDLIEWVNAELARRRQRERTRSFDDLLTDLARALADPATGPMLAAHMARSFHVALIDEFQDTDPVQYAIFRDGFVHQGRPVFLVGDPKQAIYSFRGADIFAYLDARRDAQHHYTLDTNRRSQPELVRLVNRLFARPLPFVLSGIDYQPVKASPASGETLVVDDDRCAVSFQWLPVTGAKGHARLAATDLAAEGAAHEIARLLRLSAEGGARIEGPGGSRPLNGGDIAVLVATHSQGDRIRQALSVRGVASVALTQESVFASREAGELLALLRAWAEPASESRLRAALATELGGFDARQLTTLVNDDTAWEERLSANHADHARWQARGFMAAWRAYFAREQLAARLLPLPDGERRLTNLAHLAELIQNESEHRPGIAPLLAWFEGRVADPPQGEDAVLRLESDAALVQIVTVHASKGLEYPLVFCPFLWDGRLERRDTAFWRYREADTAWLTPAPLADERVQLLSRSEILAEKLRLLYVALTRARFRQYIAWGHVQGMETAALAWLLHGEGINTLEALEKRTLDAGCVEADLERFLGDAHDCAGRLALQTAVEPVPRSLLDARPLSARRFERVLYTPWRVASFTSLTRSGHLPAPLAEAPDHDAAVVAAVTEPVAADGAPLVPDRFAFPRGARAGTCLHAIFERIDFTDPPQQHREVVREQLARHGFDARWEDAACDMVARTLAVPLSDTGACLGQVAATARLIELEFTLPVGRLDVAALVRILSRPESGLAVPLRRAAAALDFSTVRGYLKGFIDLVCRIDGRFYLVDYKSNHLGNQPTDYTSDRLADAVASAHYYLQYLLYTVALRRYLSARGLDFAAVFGGVRYLFLRGVSSTGEGVWADLPAPDLLDAIDACLGGQA
ncbi:exodeoxyribonuclease V subunit beta [Gulbenkiania mobilis]|uniref:exodeoxyribonuclease V subunit beta n=1 Tax=Gulbenkiania mobilis TaxID=397457 RepID=UPI0006BBA235|nr:exodeoxyribonuclease V subunit beta [Gulbenkiania mobilis]